MDSGTIINKSQKILPGGVILRIAIIALAAYLFMQKEINFQVNVQSSSIEQIEDEQLHETGNISSEKRLSGDQPESSSRLSGLKASLFGVSKKKLTKKTSSSKKKQIQLQDINPNDVEAYISRFSNVAVSEMRKFGIPASIILANGLLQSGAGKTATSSSSHNHFNLLCDSSWNGKMKDFDGQCFKSYESAWAGYRGHSEYLSQNFGQLKKSADKDYTKWAKGLKKGNFNGQKNLAKKLINTIEKYDLDQFDRN
ncbi:MAG: flagellum-specific peptidoglycan hydrolase FlgJ [Maribacter sp.]|jgi:flagellum-specific peptidoglycan hydrolase FlgJ